MGWKVFTETGWKTFLDKGNQALDISPEFLSRCIYQRVVHLNAMCMETVYLLKVDTVSDANNVAKLLHIEQNPGAYV